MLFVFLSIYNKNRIEIVLSKSFFLQREKRSPPLSLSKIFPAAGGCDDDVRASCFSKNPGVISLLLCGMSYPRLRSESSPVKITFAKSILLPTVSAREQPATGSYKGALY